MSPTSRRLRLALLALALAPLAVSAQDRDSLVWRKLDPANTVHMETSVGPVIFELNPLFAPSTVEQFKRLIGEDFYRGLSFYRVIDGFVAQGGDESDISVPNSQPRLNAEFEIEWSDELNWTPVQRNDLFAEETGFIDGFAAARSEKDKVWLTHCPGVLAMARNTEPDTGSTDFYIVIGQAPRYLDRNLTIFGRVVHGMDAVQRIRRGPTEANGIIDSDVERSRILRARMGNDLPPEEQSDIYVVDTNGDSFSEYMQARRNRTHQFFFNRPPKVLDVCQVPVGSRIEKRPSSRAEQTPRS